MKGKRSSSVRGGQLLFLVVTVYTFISFSWWTMLLLSKNSELFDESLKLRKLEYQAELNNKNLSFESTEQYAKMLAKYKRQFWMIIGEGLVFFVLLGLGAWQLQRTFKKEIQLARQQSNFLLSITHELRSPVASIRLTLETLLKRLNLEEKYKGLIHHSVEDTYRLESLVDNILLAAKFENKNYSLTFEKTDISEMLNILTERLSNLSGQGITIEKIITPGIVAFVDRLTFTSALVNLLDNAYKYAGNFGYIKVGLVTEDNMPIIEIADKGMGIPEGEKKRIFDKFYRMGDEKTRSNKGTGLGLYIVKQVIDSHKFTISIIDNIPSGTIFRIELKQSNNAT